MSKNWEDYIVGKDCDHYKVVDAMLKSKANSVFWEKWSALAMNLNIPYEKINRWRKAILHDKIEDIKSLLNEILQEWTQFTTQDSSKPTLSVLRKALSDAGLNDMAYEVKKAFEVDDHQEKHKEDKKPSPTAQENVETPKEESEKKPIPEPIPVEDLDFLKNETPLDVQVTPPAKAMKTSDDFYKLPYRFKGYALIINIIKFLYPTPDRDGATNDTKYMKDLWKQLGYEPVEHEGKFTATDIDTIVTNFIKKLDEDQDEVKSCVAFIGSHGKFGEILTWDGEAINVYQKFVYRIATCEALKEKPKLFIIQACQEFIPRTSHDNVPPETKLEMPVDDTIVCFSTIPGEPSNRDNHLGSWYIYVLTRVIMKNAHHLDLEEMIKQVQETMRRIQSEKGIKGQLPYHQNLGLKKLYFNMKP